MKFGSSRSKHSGIKNKLYSGEGFTMHDKNPEVINKSLLNFTTEKIIFIWQQHSKQSKRQVTNLGKKYIHPIEQRAIFNTQKDLINEYKKMNNSSINADKEHE